MNLVTFDMNTAFPGKADPQTFPSRVEAFDFHQYAGQHVQLRGCAPTWAHLLVAAQLLPVAGALDFLIDDGKEGISVPIHRAS